jgi:hypothetical protein
MIYRFTPETHMTDRAIHELPVPILTDAELLQEYDHSFEKATAVNNVERVSTTEADTALRRNSATMGELLRRGYTTAGPRWYRSQES